MRAICDFLALHDSPRHSDLIFVLAGKPERKIYGIGLFQQGFADRLILSVGRFEVRQVAKISPCLDLRELSSRTPPEQRHFFADLTASSKRVTIAGHAIGTHWELSALAHYLHGEPIGSILLVSTSIHLRRVHWCCERINFFRNKRVAYLAVPEELSSFHCRDWWTHPDHWSYIATEYAKLIVYKVRYRH